MVNSEVIAAMKNLAMDPSKREILAKDETCIGGLILVLSNKDNLIVQQALQTLVLLCENREAKKAVKSQLGIIDQLESIIKCKTMQESVKQLSKQLFQRLSETSESSQAPLRESQNLSRTANSQNTNSKGQAKTKLIVLQIRGLADKCDRELCSRLLLRVNGVISITFDMNKKRCMLRTRPDVKSEALASSVARSMTMIAQQVIRNEKGEESLLNFNLSNNSLVDKDKEEEVDLPDYLSDDSDHSINVDDKALKRPTDEDKKKSSGWFSMAANFLSSSFYW